MKGIRSRIADQVTVDRVKELIAEMEDAPACVNFT
jgi:hypothetical protein